MKSAEEKLKEIEKFFETLRECIEDYRDAGMDEEEIVERILFIMDMVEREKKAMH